MSTTTPAQRIFEILSGSTYFVRYYPLLSHCFQNPHASIVFCRLLYHDELRVRKNAEFFDRTDAQLAEECGLGIDQFVRARDLITAPGIALFERVRRGAPPVNHYRANYERIEAWLEFNLPKTAKSNCRKPPNRTAENPVPFKEKEEESIGESASASERRAAKKIVCGEGEFDEWLNGDSGQAAWRALGREGVSNQNGMILNILSRFWQRGLGYADVVAAISEALEIYESAEGRIRNWPAFLVRRLLEGDLFAMEPVAARTDGERARQRRDKHDYQ